MTAIKLAGIFLLLGVICSTNASSCSYPKWPNDFKWSSAGPINGMVCTQILEPNDPHTWIDNFFCHKSDHGMQGLGMRWSHKGRCSNFIIIPNCSQTLNSMMYVHGKLNIYILNRENCLFSC